MNDIEWILKMHKTDKNTEKMSIKEGWLCFLISTQEAILLSI